MKYRLTEETINFNGIIMHRIQCVTGFDNVKSGDLGGWIEKESNLSQDGNAWVYGDARVSGKAKVYGKALVYGEAMVYGNATLFLNAIVYGNAEVSGYARVDGDARVAGYAKVYGDAVITSASDYMVFKNSWSSGRYFTYTVSNKKWKVGCFYGTGEELIKQAYQNSELKGDCYKATVIYAESIVKCIESWSDQT